jgi:1-hydroxycarotenoid 3,4-desaturase
MLREHVVVIGAGVGGLTAAIMLAAAGREVTVVEAAAGPGGKVRQVAVDRVAIDAGPTVFTLRSVFDELFEAAGARLDDHVALSRSDVIARHYWDAGGRLDLHADPSRTEASIGDFAGSAAAAGYRAFAAAARRVFDLLDQNFMQSSRAYPPELMWRIGLWRIGDLVALRPYESLWKVLGEYFADPRLRQLFARYATYCGSSPFEAPATLMLIADTEARGVWRIEGGMTALVDALAGLAERCGVTLRYDRRVDALLTDGGRAAGVRLADGETIAATAVVCNADPQALAAGRFGDAARRAVRGFPPSRRSLSAMTWMVAGRADGVPLDLHNVFFSDDYPAEFRALAADRLADRPSVYVCALDRGTARAPPATERFQIIVNAPPVGDAHVFEAEEVERCTDAMRERLSRCGLTLHSEGSVVMTPNDFERRFPSTGGALYGRASHGWAASFLRQSARTRIPGLYCAGGSTHPGAGVPMAALSGRLAARTLVADQASTARSRRAAMPGGMSTRSARTVASG